MVVIDKEEYIKKTEELLRQQIYKTILADPTTRQKKEVDKPAEKHQGRRKYQWSNIQKNVFHRGRIPQILWVTQDTQSRGFPKTHSFKQGDSYLWNS